MDEKRPKQYSIAEARRNLPSLVHAVERGSPVELTRRGRRVAVLLSAEKYSALTRKPGELWARLQRFRRNAALVDLDVDGIYRDVRDRSPGRDAEL